MEPIILMGALADHPLLCSIALLICGGPKILREVVQALARFCPKVYERELELRRASQGNRKQDS